MSTVQHTPGPWENHKWNSEEHQISAKGGTIALVSHGHSLVSEAEADANARLIAAAPDLLDACRAAQGALPHYSSTGHCHTDCIRCKIAAAIRKAEEGN